MTFVSPWTEEVNAAAKQLWEMGISARVVASNMAAKHRTSLTRSAVIGRANRQKWVTPNTHMGVPGLRKARKPHIARPNGVDGALMLRLKAERKPPRFSADNRKLATTEPIESRNMKLIDLGPRDCRYPTSPDDATSHLFCGAPQYDDGPYCLHHAQICYRATPRMMENPGKGPLRIARKIDPADMAEMTGADLPHGKTFSEHSGSSA